MLVSAVLASPSDFYHVSGTLSPLPPASLQDNGQAHTDEDCTHLQPQLTRTRISSSTTTRTSSPRSSIATRSFLIFITTTGTTTQPRATSAHSAEASSDTLEHLHSPWPVKQATKLQPLALTARSDCPGISCKFWPLVYTSGGSLIDADR